MSKPKLNWPLLVGVIAVIAGVGVFSSVRSGIFNPETRQAEPPPETASTPVARSGSEALYEDALESGLEAAELAQTAQTADEWQEVVVKWKIAIETLDNSNHLDAPAKINEYQENLTAANQRLAAAGGEVASAPATSNPVSGFMATLNESEGSDLLVEIGSIQMTDEGVVVPLTTQWPNLNSAQQEKLVTDLGRIWRTKAGKDANLFVSLNGDYVGSATVHGDRVVVQVD
ncbi:MAG: hypothetical protein AAF215_05380 [Cyanobacteria bacterium P01_A01_bin.123]